MKLSHSPGESGQMLGCKTFDRVAFPEQSLNLEGMFALSLMQVELCQAVKGGGPVDAVELST